MGDFSPSGPPKIRNYLKFNQNESHSQIGRYKRKVKIDKIWGYHIGKSSNESPKI